MKPCPSTLRTASQRRSSLAVEGSPVFGPCHRRVRESRRILTIPRGPGPRPSGDAIGTAMAGPGPTPSAGGARKASGSRQLATGPEGPSAVGPASVGDHRSAIGSLEFGLELGLEFGLELGLDLRGILGLPPPPSLHSAAMLERLGTWLVVLVLALSGQSPIVWAEASPGPAPSCCGSACRCGDSCPCEVRRSPAEDPPQRAPLGLEREGHRAVPSGELAVHPTPSPPAAATATVSSSSAADRFAGGRGILLRKHVLRT
jgi:hypothetical protein